MSSSSSRLRARRDQRLSQPPPIRLTERDLAILRAVYEFRVLTTQQLQQLFFPSLHQTYARLSLLYHHGFVERLFLGVHADKMNTPILYTLDRRGAETLQAEQGSDVQWGKRNKEVTAQFLEHTIAINTVRIAVVSACSLHSHYSLLEWRSENDLKADYDRVVIRKEAGRTQSVSVIPDSYFVLNTPRGKTAFFLELDRGTMTTKRFKTKILAYQVYYESGAYQRRFQTKSLRVLTVTTSAVRLENLKRVTEEAGGKLRYWFSTLSQMSGERVLTAPVWELATQRSLQPLVD
jgi:hypothetical protein